MKNFKRVYKQKYLDSVPQRFKNTYEEGSFGDKTEIINKLLDLKKPISAGSINKIIKNETWTNFKCDFCKKDCDLLIKMTPNDEVEYNLENTYICPDCIEKIYSLSTEIPFVDFLKNNDAYNKYMHNIKIENQRWDEIGEYKSLYEIKNSGPENWICCAFYWDKQKEGRQYWEQLDKKWVKIVEENNYIIWDD